MFATRRSGTALVRVRGARVSSSTPASRHGHSDVSFLTAVSAGGISGVLSGLSGVGGGMLLVPAVARTSKMPMQVINGTCYAALTVSGFVGAWNYAKADLCNYAVAAFTFLPAMVTARSGVKLAQRMSSQRLSTVVGVAMLASAPLVALKDTSLADRLPSFITDRMELSHHEEEDTGEIEGKVEAHNSLDVQHFGMASAHGHPDPEMQSRGRFYRAAIEDPAGLLLANWRYLAVGAFSGFVSGLCGIGGSLITTLYLTTSTDMPQRAVVGTTLVSVLPMAVSTNVHNYKVKALHMPTAVRIGTSLCLAVHLTSQYVLTHPVPESFLRDVLSATIAAGAIMTIRRSI